MSQRRGDLAIKSMKSYASDQVQIAVPHCEPGIGAVIRIPSATDLISGVVVNASTLWPDDRGYFLEVFRTGQGVVAPFSQSQIQVSTAVSYPGTIKAFHFHKNQSDVWVPVLGMFQIALVDLRPESPTFGRKNTLYTGSLQPWKVLIPPGVGHGYKVIGDGPATLVYVTDQFYDANDEGRIPYNDPSIQYDWEIQYK